jgi:hypothetical protein
MLAIEEVMGEIEAPKTMEDGHILILTPRLIEQMTKPDRVEVLAWHVSEHGPRCPARLPGSRAEAYSLL